MVRRRKRNRPKPNGWVSILWEFVKEDESERVNLPELNIEEILAWADAHFANRRVADVPLGSDSGVPRGELDGRASRTLPRPSGPDGRVDAPEAPFGTSGPIQSQRSLSNYRERHPRMGR